MGFIVIGLALYFVIRYAVRDGIKMAYSDITGKEIDGRKEEFKKRYMQEENE